MALPQSSIVERPCPAPVGDARFQAVSLVVQRLEGAGFATFLVGGCVRDMAIGRIAKDFDVATAATPEEIEDLFDKTISVGKAFGVMQVASQGLYFEVATFRKDLEYQDGRRPEGVTFCGAEEDVLRRDFRVNGLLYHVQQETILDHVGGLHDLDKKLIRAIGDPSERFQEDHLRLLRALRFSVQLGFEIDPDTWNSLCRHASNLEKISRERIRDELMKMLDSDAPSEAFSMMVRSECLPHVLPVEPFQSGAFSQEKVLSRITNLYGQELETRTLALLSSILFELVVPASCDWDALYRSDGGRKALAYHLAPLEACVSQLRLSRSEEHRVMGTVALAAFLVHQCNERHPDHVWLRLARWPGASDGYVLARVVSDAENVRNICAQFGGIEKEKHSPALLINGQDLQALSVAPGPHFKDILRAVEDAQLDGEITDRQEALNMAQNLAAKVTL